MKTTAISHNLLKLSVLASTGAVTLLPSFTQAATVGANQGAYCTSSNPVNASDPISAGAGCAASKSNSTSLFGSGGIFHTIADTLIYIVGAVAVIMLIIGGLRYVLSQGSKEGVSQAKDTILYSVIGIVVAILAYAIVNFVTTSLGSSN